MLRNFTFLRHLRYWERLWLIVEGEQFEYGCVFVEGALVNRSRNVKEEKEEQLVTTPAPETLALFQTGQTVADTLNHVVVIDKLKTEILSSVAVNYLPKFSTQSS